MKGNLHSEKKMNRGAFDEKVLQLNQYLSGRNTNINNIGEATKDIPAGIESLIYFNSDPYSIAACLKHYIGYGRSEGGRDYRYSDISRQSLWETYMPPYHACVKAGAATLMSAFNDISGVPASANHYTLTEILKVRWKLNVVEFFDVTDRFNTLVRSVDAYSGRHKLYRGNLLFAYDNTSDNGVFILKESPTSNVQLAYPGSDFITEYGALRAVGIGINPTDLETKDWKRGYGFVTGVYSGNEQNGLMALRNYQKNLRLHKSVRDEMVLMNTWGDRGQDKRINEKFALAELEVGEKLGISHFQLDDGWQAGRSANSAFEGGSFKDIWRDTTYWLPDPKKFPEGLRNLVDRGRELGIQICLWFNPSPDESNRNWEKDADMLIKLYRKYGIRTFKIDGAITFELPKKNSYALYTYTVN
jgi:hypothetical protein